jgi:hypothetical protein
MSRAVIWHKGDYVTIDLVNTNGYYQWRKPSGTLYFTAAFGNAEDAWRYLDKLRSIRSSGIAVSEDHETA